MIYPSCRYTYYPGWYLTGSFNLSTLVDDIDEENETFTITLSNPSEASIGAQSTTTITITDNDNPPTIFVGTLAQLAGGTAINKEVDEDVGATNFQITVSPQSEKAISIDYSIDLTNSTAKDGQDYNSLASSGTINLAAGETSTTIDFNVLSDLVSEPAQTIIIELDPLSAINATADGAMYTGTMTIQMMILHQLSILMLDPQHLLREGANGNTSTKTFTVTLSDTSEKTIIVPYTVAGVVNTNGEEIPGIQVRLEEGRTIHLPANTLTINPLLSLSSANINITVVGDDIDEYNESFTITLGGDDLANATLHPTNATVWTYEITDDDDAPTASISAGDAAAENIAPDATITLSAASEKVTSFTVTPADVTATLSSDEGVDGGDYYIENSTVSIAAGETYRSNRDYWS